MSMLTHDYREATGPFTREDVLAEKLVAAHQSLLRLTSRANSDHLAITELESTLAQRDAEIADAKLQHRELSRKLTVSADYVLELLSEVKALKSTIAQHQAYEAEGAAAYWRMRDEAAPWDEMTDEQKQRHQPDAGKEIHGKREVA